jgi:hypothetical protein
MVEESDARIDFVFTNAIEIQLDRDIGFLCLPVDFRRSLFHNGILVIFRRAGFTPPIRLILIADYADFHRLNLPQKGTEGLDAD